MPDTQSQQKWNTIYANASIGEATPAKILTSNQHLLPTKGRALDFACGLGANAIFLARLGLDTDAWDISDVARDKINAFATQNALPLSARAVDLTVETPPAETYDVIVVAHYLDRETIPMLISALKTGGIILYQTFATEVTSNYTGPKNPGFRLGTNEMLALFDSLRTVVYREEGLIGDHTRGDRNLVFYIGQKISTVN